MPKIGRDAYGYVYVYAAAALWSTIGVAAKLGMAAGGSPLGLALVRTAVAGFAAVVLSLTSRHARRIALSVPVALLGLLVVAPFHYVYMVAIERLGVALAVVLLYTAPIWVLAARAAFSRSVRRSDAAAVAMAVAGVTLIYLPSSSAGEAIWDIAWGLASGLLYAALIVGSRAVLEKVDFLKGRLTPAAAAISVQGWAAPSLALAIALSGAGVGRSDVVSGLYLGLVSSIVAYYLFYEGLSRVPPERASVAATLEPLLGVFWGVLLLGEAMGPSRALGAALVILSQLFISLAGQDSSRVPS